MNEELFLCPNCGASAEEDGMDDKNEFGEWCLRCCACGAVIIS